MLHRLLFVDDDEHILEGYKRNLRTKFMVTTCSDPKKALDLIKTSEPFSVVVSDYKMPGMDGVTFLSWVREFSKDSVRIMLTGFADITNAINAVNQGNVFRFLTKPINNEHLITALNDAINQYNLVISERELLNKTLKGSIKVLVDMLSTLNPTAFSYASSISRTARKIALRLKLPDSWEVELSSLLSQIGCVTIPQDLLEKRIAGYPLSEEESKIFLSHPEIGSAFIKNIPRLELVSEAIKFQFKRFDEFTDEYKKNVDTKAIVVLSQIIKASADFDAYIQSGIAEIDAVQMLYKETGKYDPQILSALEAEVAGAKKEFLVKNLAFTEIRDGMIIAQDIYDTNNMILLRKGMEINDILLARLSTLLRVKKITEPIKVFVPL